MDPQLHQWLRANTGKVFGSPRKNVFGRNPQSFKIVKVDEESGCIRVAFRGGATLALPLYFWMFDRTLDYLRNSPDTAFPIGARLQPPYPRDSIEDEIWREPRLYSSPYKAAPHVLDILYYAGMVEFTYTRDRETGRKVQGAKYAPDTNIQPPECASSSEDPKQEFLSKHKDTIIEWAERNKYTIIRNRNSYSWKRFSRLECERSRNQVSREIILSRIRNNGALDLETLDRVMRWGFNREYPDRDPVKALQVTKKAFDHLDKGDIERAALTLLKVKGLGISRVSKILGLSDQENLCIYDSRVGYALRTLEYNGKKLFLIPPSQVRPGDVNISDAEWAQEYQRLIWAAEIMRDHMDSNGCTYRMADVEMALYMMGQ